MLSLMILSMGTGMVTFICSVSQVDGDVFPAFLRLSCQHDHRERKTA